MSLTKYIEESYEFDASARTITFNRAVTPQEILVITNVTDGIIIYSFGCAGFTGIVSGAVLTLTYDTTSMSDSDELLIIMTKQQSDTDIILTRISDDIRDIKELIVDNINNLT